MTVNTLPDSTCALLRGIWVIRLTTLLACFGILAACGGGGGKTPSPPDRPEPIEKSPQNRASTPVYKYLGSVQCSGGGTSLTEMRRHLTEGGVQVIKGGCGVDGKLYIAMCGAADGRIGIFEIPAQQVQAASTLGFAPLTELPSASEVACQ